MTPVTMLATSEREQAVQGTVAPLVVGRVTTSSSPSWVTVMPAGQLALQGALGPLDGDRVAASVTVTGGDRDGRTSDT